MVSLPICNQIGSYAFGGSKFCGSLNLPVCVLKSGSNAFRVSNFSGSLILPVCTQIGR